MCKIERQKRDYQREQGPVTLLFSPEWANIHIKDESVGHLI